MPEKSRAVGRIEIYENIDYAENGGEQDGADALANRQRYVRGSSTISAEFQRSRGLCQNPNCHDDPVKDAVRTAVQNPYACHRADGHYSRY